jgi:ribosome-associated protein
VVSLNHLIAASQTTGFAKVNMGLVPIVYLFSPLSQGNKKKMQRMARKPQQSISAIKTQSDVLKDAVVNGMLEKKALNIMVMDLRNIHNAVADFFVICTGNSDTQVQAVMDSVEEMVYKTIKQSPWAKEASAGKGWVLLDYVDVVAHVFQKDKREYYGLEELWGDALIMNVTESNLKA